MTLRQLLITALLAPGACAVALADDAGGAEPGAVEDAIAAATDGPTDGETAAQAGTDRSDGISDSNPGPDDNPAVESRDPTVPVAEAAATPTASDETGGSDGGTPAITILDQTVPVADEPADAAGPAGPADTDPRAELHAAFERYKTLRSQGVLDQAENVAKQVVEMSIRISGPTSNETASALSNLAIVQHETKDYEAAQQNFASAIEIIEDNEDRLNSKLINPLKGLGAAQLESGRPDLALASYGRAVHISHVNEGPHNLDQVELLEALAETNLRVGDLEQAKNAHDMIYSLSLRYYNGNAMDIVPSLLRRAKWQRRTGYILDERATYRRIIRIIESSNGKDDLMLIEPLMNLGQSYFFPDQSESASFQNMTVASGEMYFKRAVRIAEENPDADWQLEARTKLALGDYYNLRTDLGRARKNYREAWQVLSAGDNQLDMRRRALEQVVVLNEESIPRYIGGATRNDQQLEDPAVREGRIVVTYDVNTRGRVSSLKIVEADPEEFEDIRRMVQRELRTRIFRPRFEEAEAVITADQVFTHTFYYRQDELDELRAAADRDKT